MAFVPASYTNIDSGWFNTTTPRSITGLSWSAGDIIVIFGGTENDATTLNNPTNANLTIGAPKADGGSPTGTECTSYMWVSDPAAGAQSGQSIACSAAGSVQEWGCAAWVITGDPTGFANANTNINETPFSLTVSANSIICYGALDFNATNPPDKTPLAGGGGATTLRLNQGSGSTYAQWLYDEVGTSAGTFNFGPNNYTSLRVNQAIVEIQGPADVPDAPTGLAGKGDLPGVAFLTWTAPAANPPITDYDVDYALASAPTSWLGTVATGSTVAEFLFPTPLENGTAYVFRVRAVNSEGDGAWSSTSASVIPDGPQATIVNTGQRRI